MKIKTAAAFAQKNYGSFTEIVKTHHACSANEIQTETVLR